MRVVAAPHELVDADGVTRLRLAGAREAGCDPAVAGEVLARLERQPLVVGVLDLADAAGRHLRVVAVDHRERARDPRRSLFGDDELQVGMPLEHAGEDEVPQGAV